MASNRTEATKLTHQDIQIRTSSPTIRTRLTERTQSISNLQDAIDSKEKMSKEQYMRIKEPLSKAVFQEWYFKKSELETERKRAEAAKRAEDRYEKEAQEEEKQELANDEYNKWLKSKRTQLKKQLRKLRNKENRSAVDTDDKASKCVKAVEDWKAKKLADKLKQERKEKRAKKEREKADKLKADRETESLRRFDSWKNKINEDLKKRMEEEKAKRLAELEKKREEARGKKEDAESAFKAWKAAKDEMKKSRSDGSKLDKNNNERNDAARRAYDDWLEFTEQREREEKYAEEERILRDLWRPPWYPGGIADY